MHSSDLGTLLPGGPAQSDLLTHFCGRASKATSPDVPQHIRDLHPRERLESILWDGVLFGSRGFQSLRAGAQPAISFSESPDEHLRWLIREKSWPSWGLVFHRQAIYDAGGGPAWHVRTEHLAALPPELVAWAVRFDATPGLMSDWLHEREWRVPRDKLMLEPRMLRAILIGDPTWEPGRMVPTGGFIDIHGLPAGPGGPCAVEEVAPELPWLWEQVPRWYYDPDQDEMYELES